VAINQTAPGNDEVVPEEVAYGVGSSMPGDEHVADGRVGARTVGAEADVVVVIVRLPPPPQPTRTRGPCYRVAAILWFLLLRAAARPRDSRVAAPQPPHRRLPPAIQEASLRQGHGGGGCRRRAAVGPRGPRAGWNLTSREAREQARSADFGRWGGSPATRRGSSSRSDFGERGRPPRRTCGARGDEDAPMRTSRPVAKRESRWSCLRCDTAGTNAIAGRGRGLMTGRFREYCGAPDSSLNG